MAIRFKQVTPEEWPIERVRPHDVARRHKNYGGQVMFPSSHDINTIDDVDAHGNGTTAVKVLSGKSNDEIKKMLETFRENQKEYNLDDPEVMNLYNEFKELMIPDRHRLVN